MGESCHGVVNNEIILTTKQNDIKTKTCRLCREEKFEIEFQKDGLDKEGNQKYKNICKVCVWFNNRNIKLAEGWSLNEYKIIIDLLYNEKVEYVNDIIPFLDNKSLDDLITLLKHNLKLKGCKMNVKHSCDYCGVESFKIISQYKKRNNHFCNKECHDKFQNKSVIKQCDNCGIDISVPPRKIITNRHFFCSNNCEKEHKKKYSRIDVDKWITFQCEFCGKDKTVTIKNYERAKHNFCCVECYNDWQKENAPKGVDSPVFKSILIKCDWCGENHYVHPYKLNNENQENYFCSKKCANEWFAKDYSQRDEVKERNREIALRNLKNGLIPQAETKPHVNVMRLLDKLNIKYEYEENYKYYSIDIVLYNGLLIEVMGGFWHCDNRIYPKINYKLQIDNIIKDKSKRTYIKKYHDIDILYLWENDINNNIDICEKLILKYIDDNGKLKNYHSFNYVIEKNNKIKLIHHKLKPYMDWDIDDLNSIVDIKVKEKRSQKQADKWVNVKCDCCGTEYEMREYMYINSINHFCSVKCKNQYQKGEWVKVTCNNCKESFEVPLYKYNINKTKQFYCNEKCYRDFTKRNSVKVTCNCCNKEFEVIEAKYKVNKAKIFYCSRECYVKSKSNKITFSCETCDKEKTVKTSVYNASNHHFCSRSCATIFNNINRGVGLIEFMCEHCGKTGFKNAGDYNKSNHHFCNTSCAVSYNNKHRHKKEK